MLHPGEELHGRYIVEGLVGSGGMGTVYRAQDTLKDRLVALKEFQMDHLPSANSEAGGDDTHLHTGPGPGPSKSPSPGESGCEADARCGPERGKSQTSGFSQARSGPDAGAQLGYSVEGLAGHGGRQ